MGTIEYTTRYPYERRVGRRVSVGPVPATWLIPEVTGRWVKKPTVREVEGLLVEVSVTGAGILGPPELDLRVRSEVLVRVGDHEGVVTVRHRRPLTDASEYHGVELTLEAGGLKSVIRHLLDEVDPVPQPALERFGPELGIPPERPPAPFEATDRLPSPSPGRLRPSDGPSTPAPAPSGALPPPPRYPPPPPDGAPRAGAPSSPPPTHPPPTDPPPVVEDGALVDRRADDPVEPPTDQDTDDSADETVIDVRADDTVEPPTDQDNDDGADASDETVIDLRAGDATEPRPDSGVGDEALPPVPAAEALTPDTPAPREGPPARSLYAWFKQTSQASEDGDGTDATDGQEDGREDDLPSAPGRRRPDWP